MRIIPAIDLCEGSCVRLFQGDFEQRTGYGSDPLAIAGTYASMGFEDLHVVDLDGARSGRQQNRDMVARLASDSGLRVQLGGGIRDLATIESWLSLGVERLVIGSMAVNEPAMVRDWCRRFGVDRIVLALDVRLEGDTPRLAVHGWTELSELTLWQCLDGYADVGVRHVLCTDVSRDGAMSGPSLDLYREFVSRYPDIRLQASGGVRHLDDLEQLEQLGAHSAITGRALLDGDIGDEEVRSFLRAG